MQGTRRSWRTYKKGAYPDWLEKGETRGVAAAQKQRKGGNKLSEKKGSLLTAQKKTEEAHGVAGQ